MRDPIYQQLHQILRAVIKEGSYAVGAKFLTEREISQRYQVSRATSNKVLSSLVSEGLLEFRKGVGSFVRGELVEKNQLSLVSFSENVRSSGMTPSSEVLFFRTIDAFSAPTTVTSALTTKKGDTLFEVKRVRLVDGIPLILEHRYIVSKYCQALELDDLKGSFYQTLSNKFGISIQRIEETIQPAVILPEEMEILKVESGRAGFLVTTVGFMDDGMAVWWEQALHHPDGFEFRCQVRPTNVVRDGRLHFAFSGKTNNTTIERGT
jgi:GntR family transcriptional regulator